MDMHEGEAHSRDEVNVNGQTYDLGDPVVLGREILTLSGHVPATEHQLILIHHSRSCLIGSDDKVDLHKERGAVFRAFRSDRTWAFTLNEGGQVWGAEALDVGELRRLWGVPGDLELVLERDDDADVVLTEGGTVNLGGAGVEDIVTRLPKPGFVLVSVHSTAGVYPAEGSIRVKASTTIADVIERARAALEIVPGTDWIIQVGTRDIDPSLTFAGAMLAGTVELSWGPREGGGGAR